MSVALSPWKDARSTTSCMPWLPGPCPRRRLPRCESGARRTPRSGRSSRNSSRSTPSRRGGNLAPPPCRLSFEDVVGALAPKRAWRMVLRRVVAAAAVLVLVGTGFFLARTISGRFGPPDGGEAGRPLRLAAIPPAAEAADVPGAEVPAALADYRPVEGGKVQWFPSFAAAEAVARASSRPVLPFHLPSRLLHLHGHAERHLHRRRGAGSPRRVRARARGRADRVAGASETREPGVPVARRRGPGRPRHPAPSPAAVARSSSPTG